MKNYNIWDLHQHKPSRSKTSHRGFIKPNFYWSKKKLPIKKIIIQIFLYWLWVLLVWWFILARVFIYSDLPDVSEVRNMVFSQATIIQDRNGVELYKVFSENREYIDFSGVNTNMINAIIAIEDQRYREHQWLDPMWIFRAAVSKVLNPASRLQWASTIPQQLVRNLLLTKDRKVQRKLKEMVLTKKLNWVLEDRVRKEQGKLDSTKLKRAIKEKTLELYLNYISFGNNSFWIQAASKTYFGIPADQLNILQSSILASLPKWPSLYDPYKRRCLLMWEIQVKDWFWNDVSLDQSFLSDTQSQWTWATVWSSSLKAQVLLKFQQAMSSADLSNKRDANSFIKFVEWLWSFNIFFQWQEYYIKYANWRKDITLWRMYEDWYIDESQLKDAFLQWLDLQFKKNIFPIKAPHFVQWIIEELENEFGKETVTNWWLTVTTTLDYNMQQVAEQALLNNIYVLQDNWASNSSMIYIDTYSWDVLAYVGSLDYFNEQIQWQNDMIRRPRQSWSAIKPFIYSLWFDKLPLTIDTPIYDIPFQIWPDKPNNADDKFEWLLPLKWALGHSRNIPSTKMFLALGWEEVAKPFLINLWLKWISPSVNYGYTLALWAWEVTMLELANAYSHLTMWWKPAEISPILEIKSSDWSIIYQKEVQYQDNIIKPWIWYILRNILSDPANRLGWRASKFNVSWLKFALKTWTSNVKTEKWSRPRDGWLASYTPSKVALFRAWNADATPMNRNAFGWTIHANPVKSFLWELLNKWYIQNEEMPKIEVASTSISKVSWKLPWDSTPWDWIVSTIWYIKSMPWTIDDPVSSIQFDSSCNGKISPYTPAEESSNWYIITPSTFMPNEMDLQEIIDRRKQSTQLSWENPMSWKVVYNFNNVFLQEPVDFCEGRTAQEDTSIKVNIIKPESEWNISTKASIRYEIQSPADIEYVNVMIDQTQVWTFKYPSGRKSLTDIKAITSNDIKPWKHELKLIAITSEWFSNSQTIEINIVSKDTQPPFIIENKSVVKQNEDWSYTVLLLFEDDLSSVLWWKILWSSGEVLNEFKDNFASFQMPSLGLVSIQVKDSYDNLLSKDIDLNQYLK